jgi:hypothetical protein
MSPRLVLPPDHRIVITVESDPDSMGVTVEAFYKGTWIGAATVNSIDDDGRLQAVVDMLTKRGPRLEKR